MENELQREEKHNYETPVAAQNGPMPTNEHLHDSELKTLINSIDDLVFTIDIDNQHTQIFGNWLTKRGLKTMDFLGDECDIDSDQAEKRSEAISKAFEGNTVRCEWCVLIDGSVKQIQASLSPIRNPEGHVTGVVGVGRDVTDLARSEKLSNALNMIHAEIGSSLDAKCVMHTIVKKASEALGVECGNIILREDGRWIVRHTSGTQKLRPGKRLCDEDLPYLRLIEQTSQPIAINDTSRDVRVNNSIANKYEMRAVLGIPLVVTGELLGVLSLVSTSKPVTFTNIDIDFARKLGLSASLALTNSCLYEAERRAKLDTELARTELEEHHNMLQLALLPGETHVASGYRLATKFVPGAANKSIGGDFYDVFETEDGQTAIMIGDVSGKGVEAAALAAATRNTVRAFAYDLGDPAMALTHTNSVLIESPMADHYATAFVAILDPTTGEFTYSSAGHPPPAIHRTDGSVELLYDGQLPIGVRRGTQYLAHKAYLGVGEQLVMYTDGISEAHKGHRMFDIEGVCRTIMECSGCSPDEALEALFAGALELSGGHLADDAAVVIIERNRALSGVVES